MSDTNQDKSQDGGDGSSEYIKLKVVGHDSNEIHFRVKMSTQMGKVKKSYSERVGVPMNALRFLLDGRRINDDETPKQLEMEGDQELDVFVDRLNRDYNRDHNNVHSRPGYSNGRSGGQGDPNYSADTHDGNTSKSRLMARKSAYQKYS